MSLFGDEAAESPLGLPPSRSQKSLFDDEPSPAAASRSSLFADDDVGGGESPWSFPTPKRAARGNLVKTLLPAAEVPESYIDTYDALLDSGDRVGAGLSLTGIKKLLADSGLSAEDQGKVLDIVLPDDHEAEHGVGRGEFNVLLALIGLAQEKEDISLDGVDDRRKNLPQPSLPSSAKPSESVSKPQPKVYEPQQKGNLSSSHATPAASPARTRIAHNGAEFPETDPWASPAPHKSSDAPASNGNSNSQTADIYSTVPNRTASFTSHSEAPTSNNQSAHIDTGSAAGGWGSYDGANAGFVGANTSGLGEGFGIPGGDDGDNLNSGLGGRSLGPGRIAGSGIEEIVTVTVLPEKEGMFLFQHRNYQIASSRRASNVIRRYSDFVWLLDCLHKRYPFRQLPLLPPKRVAVNGNHLSSDAGFIEKRRRGLARFTNALVRHPVLSQEQLVIMFLTVPTELAVWRKQATISVQEEFIGKALPPTLEDSLPPSLNETFDTVRSGVRRSAEIYINLCSVLERLSKRKEGIAADYLRFSLGLQSLTETSENTYAIDTNDVPLLNEGLNSTAKHLSASQSLLEDEARAWDEGILEDLKRQRDALVSMRDMFDRRDRFAKDNIPALEKKISNNENKLAGLRARTDGVKPGEVEKVEDAIIKDKQSIVSQHARGVFIKECLRDEVVYFQSSQFHVSRMHQDWSQERVKYAELQADNWRGLSEELEGMPLGE
ncbi:MAG: hypothetical protein M1819_000440 [Sarea resinae]|nr:MAG: hypothetical protein M1819_000440 [Sarea resinae]